jgi:hypothetical protein
MIDVRFLRGRLWFVLPVVLAALLATTGCGSAVKAYPVSGQVNFNGKPMAGTGSITFVPIVQTEGAMMAGGEVAADGTYKLTTSSPNDGAMTGEYRVVITQVTVVEPKPVADGEKPPAVVAALAPDQLIPAIYGDHAKSPLTATVKVGNNKIDFELPVK